MQGVLRFLGVQNVVNWVVHRGGIVVKVWLETPANRRLKTRHFFEIFLWISPPDLLVGLTSDPKEEDSWVG